jgi:hypothetical protein
VAVHEHVQDGVMLEKLLQVLHLHVALCAKIKWGLKAGADSSFELNAGAFSCMGLA